MTTEKAIEFGKIFLKTIADEKGSATYEFVETAVKMMEQQPILDKIRAEIEQNAYPIVHGVNNHEKGMTLYGILQIFDKYKMGGKE